MRHSVVVLAALLIFGSSAPAAGLLIPTEKKLPPLAMLNHHVSVAIEDQVAVTRIEQTFRNHTDRQLEATYLFPVPKGASVRKFSMWVDGKEVPGELVEADKARKIYTDIVQRTLDPGLLEYMGNNLLKLRVFPVPPKGDQKIALSYTAIADAGSGLVEYLYPLRTEGRAASTLEKFSLSVKLKSQHPVTNIYSPSHAITMTRPSEKEAVIGFEKEQAVLDRDFQLFYQFGDKDIGLTALNHRPSPGQNGYFLLLMSPRAELSKSQQVPRDMIFVLDTSGSMRGKRMTQARAALQYCLNNLTPIDRFAVINFATTVNRYSDQLLPADKDHVQSARKWVDQLEATGGTAIDDALKAALEMRTGDMSRTFTVVFFTDGRPTIGETNAETITKNVNKRNASNTRIFTFGVGDDVNAAMLDAISDGSRAISTYVRESEDIESRVSGLYDKISHPVLANLKLTVTNDIKLNETYPPQLPDLFHGTQLVILGRYTGNGHAAVKLTGTVGSETREFVYEVNFPDKTGDERTFVEDLWARRKVGYLLDQIRVNGEKKELVDEVVTLAKRYGITTPYTSYLLVPDSVPAPVARAGSQAGGAGGFASPDASARLPLALGGRAPGQPAMELEDFARQIKDKKELATLRNRSEEDRLRAAESVAPANGKDAQAIREARDQRSNLGLALDAFQNRRLQAVQEGALGVNFSVHNNMLRNQSQLTRAASRNVQSRNVLEVGGVWIDEDFDAKAKSVTVKAMSPAYFRLLERHPRIRDVYQLGNYVVWMTPSGTALIIDQNAGQEQIPDADLDRLFVAAKK